VTLNSDAELLLGRRGLPLRTEHTHSSSRCFTVLPSATEIFIRSFAAAMQCCYHNFSTELRIYAGKLRVFVMDAGRLIRTISDATFRPVVSCPVLSASIPSRGPLCSLGSALRPIHSAQTDAIKLSCRVRCSFKA